MRDISVSFIGCGNMATAMINGIVKAGKVSADHIMASNRSSEKLEAIEASCGIKTTLDNCKAAAFADILFLSVKPQFYEQVIAEIKDSVKENVLIVTIAPGKTLAWLAEKFGSNRKILRTMPNTPAMVGEGMMGICPNENMTTDDVNLIQDICKSFSRAQVVPENLMDVVTAVSGSSPAYVFMFIEAMADAAVAGGMPRAQAYEFAAQSVLGSAKMVLETGKHPGELKDMVCSPAGTTIEAVRVLEDKGLRSAVMEAMKACLDKSKGM